MFIILIIEYKLHRESQSHYDFSVSLSLVKDLKEMTDRRLLFKQKQILFYPSFTCYFGNNQANMSK